MEDELVEHIDPAGNILGIISKHAAHREGWMHKAVVAEVRDPQGNIVLVRQAPGRQEAGLYVCPVGGHVKAGESELDAVKREAAEEIGVTIDEAEPLLRYVFDRHIIGRHENHFFVLFRITVNPAAIKLGPEATEHRTFTPAELKEALTASPQLFGHSYHDFMQRHYPLGRYQLGHTADGSQPTGT